MIRLGLRLAVSGGREAVVRLVVVAAAVGIGVGLLLTVAAAVNAVNVQNDLIVPEGASGCAVAFVRSDGLAPEPPAGRARYWPGLAL